MGDGMTATASGMRSHRVPATWFTPYLIATWDMCQKTDWDGLIDRLVAHKYDIEPVQTYISNEAAKLMFVNPPAAAAISEVIQWWK
jgi:hypothetical protein